MTERFYYLASDYYATGEGRTLSLMICIPYAREEDYEVPAHFKDNVFVEGIRKKGHTDKVIAIRTFIEEFGNWYGQGVELFDRDTFFKKFGHLIPDLAKDMTEPDRNDRPGNFYWKQELHFNFS